MRKRHQRGYLRCVKRKNGPAVWEFLWREVGPNGKLVRRTTIIGNVEKYPTQESALAAVSGLRASINDAYNRQQHASILMGELIDHYKRTELTERGEFYSHATKRIYADFLETWIEPHWKLLDIREVRTVAVENWLRTLCRCDVNPLSNSTKAKIRNLLSVLFNHAIRYEWLEQGKNPISHVRQSAARQKATEILHTEEARTLLGELEQIFALMVLICLTTGLRRSEVLALKWTDIDFEKHLLRVTRSIYVGIVGSCKTESSKAPLPLAPYVLTALSAWRRTTGFAADDDWVFASPSRKGRLPYSPGFAMDKVIRPAAARAGIDKRISWHTFRHTFSTLLIANGENIKVVQELMRHGTARVTVEIYSHAITNVKRRAQQRIVKMIMP